MGMYGSKDMKVVVEKTKILEILKRNREKHLADYAKARVGYVKTALAKQAAVATLLVCGNCIF